MGKIKFLASNYFAIRTYINTAFEKNFAPIVHQKLQKGYAICENVFKLLKVIVSVLLYPECTMFLSCHSGPKGGNLVKNDYQRRSKRFISEK